MEQKQKVVIFVVTGLIIAFIISVSVLIGFYILGERLAEGLVNLEFHISSGINRLR